jgi:chorismate synthase
LEHGVTLGTPIALLVKNEDQRPHDYSETDLYPRPSHADYTYLEKYGLKASSGGGRSSARETIGLYLGLFIIAGPHDSSLLLGRVAAGAIAEHYLKKVYGVEIVAFVSSVGKIHLPDSLAPPSLTSLKEGEEEDEVEDALSPEFRKLLATITREEVDKYTTRCPHQETSDKMTSVTHFKIK